MSDYQPNSHRYREEQKNAASDEKRVQKVVRGNVKTKKKSEISKLTDVFISEDAANVKSYIVRDVLVPAIKKLVSDIVKDGIDMFMYGSAGGSSKTSSGSRISYRNYYDERNGDRRTSETRASRRFDYDDIVFESRAEAEAVLDQMVEVIEVFGYVTVADMYDMADLPHAYTSTKYGWTNLNTAEVTRTRTGNYIIKLPRTVLIDR